MAAPRRWLAAMKSSMNSCSPRWKISSIRLFSIWVRVARAYGRQGPAQRQARATRTQIENSRMEEIFQRGLHEFIEDFIAANHRLGAAIAEQYLV